MHYRVRDYQKISDRLYRKLGKKVFLNELKYPKVKIGTKDLEYAGYYHFKENILTLHPRLVLGVKETIAHEVCHAVAYQWKREKTHGIYWKILMRLLRLKPRVRTEDWRLSKRK